MLTTDPDESAFTNYANYRGLTKREYFAAVALQGILANAKTQITGEPDLSTWQTAEVLGMLSVVYADALIKQLNKK